MFCALNMGLSLERSTNTLLARDVLHGYLCLL